MRRSLLFAAVLSCASMSASALAQTAPPVKKKPAAKKTAEATAAASAADANAPKAPLPPVVTPPPPPPWTGPSNPATSTSGASLLPEGALAYSQPPAAPPAAIVSQDEVTSMQARLKILEARLAEDEAILLNSPELAWLRKLHLSGFIQPQALVQIYNTAASPNLVNGVLPAGVSANDAVAKSNGTTTNGDYFRLRRARLRTEFMPSEGTRFVFEIDPTPAGGTVGGTGTIARTVEAQGIARWTDDLTTEFAMGIFKLPFGYEVLQSDPDRPFIERSWGEQNLTPGEFDTGIRAYTTWAKNDRVFVAQVAVVNGQTEGQPTFSLDPGLTANKDFLGRMNFNFGDWVDFGGSGYFGVGEVVNATALRFKQFYRWAANGELGLHHKFGDVGWTKIFAEVTFAQNFDRGVHYAFALPAIPANIDAPVASLNERNVWVRLEQDLTHWTTLGVRWDEYTPETSLSNDARDTVGVVGVIHFTSWLQTMLEYDHIIEHVHAPGTVATDAQIEMGSGVLQARFY
jgi:Phosphate-selective porin O and P